MGRPHSRRRRTRSSRDRSRRRPLRTSTGSPSARRSGLRRWDVVGALRVVVLVAAVVGTLGYVSEASSVEVAGAPVLAALLLLGLAEMVVLWGEKPGTTRRTAAVSTRTLLVVLTAGGVVAGLVAAGREPGTDTDLAGPPVLLVPVMALLLLALAWLLGVGVGALVVIPLGLVANGLWTLARGGRGWTQVLLGLWILAIVAYPTCLGIAGDGPRRSLGLAPLLGLAGSAWEITSPGWLWPARVFALLTWGPVVVALVAAAVAAVRRSRTSAGASPTPP